MKKTKGKFKSGQMVCAKKNQHIMLTIRRFVDEVYFCKIQSELDSKELVFFEREIMYPQQEATLN